MKGLGRLKEFDERSRKFNISDVLPFKKPRSYTWSCPINLDQGQEGSCTGFSMAHELAARPVKVTGIDYDYAYNLYKRAQELDEWEGSDYEGSSVLAAAKAAKEAGKILEYRWAFDIDDLVISVGYHGCAVLGINWYQGMSEPSLSGSLIP